MAASYTKVKITGIEKEFDKVGEQVDLMYDVCREALNVGPESQSVRVSDICTLICSNAGASVGWNFEKAATESEHFVKIQRAVIIVFVEDWLSLYFEKTGLYKRNYMIYSLYDLVYMIYRGLKAFIKSVSFTRNIGKYLAIHCQKS